MTARSALVTGGTRRIGRAIALRLARDGLNVVVVSRRCDADAEETLRLLQAEGREALHVAADVAQEAGVEAAFGAAAVAFGRADVVVHAAGVRSTTPLADLSLAHWHDVLGANLDAAFLLSRAAAGQFGPAGGRLVFITGTVAAIGRTGRAHLAAAKAGMEGLARSLAVELAGRLVTVNCVSPGVIDTGTPGLETALQEFRIPARRLGHPEEVAAAVALLASPDGAYTTGQVLHVNGGLHPG